MHSAERNTFVCAAAAHTHTHIRCLRVQDTKLCSMLSVRTHIHTFCLVFWPFAFFHLHAVSMLFCIRMEHKNRAKREGKELSNKTFRRVRARDRSSSSTMDRGVRSWCTFDEEFKMNFSLNLLFFYGSQPFFCPWTRRNSQTSLHSRKWSISFVLCRSDLLSSFLARTDMKSGSCGKTGKIIDEHNSL